MKSKILSLLLLGILFAHVEAFADTCSDSLVQGAKVSSVQARAFCDTLLAAPKQSIIPGTDNTYDLGSASKQWRTGYFGTSIVNAGDLITTTSAKGVILGEAARAANVTTQTNVGAGLYQYTDGTVGGGAAFIAGGAGQSGFNTFYLKTRATSGAGSTIVQSGDVISRQQFFGANGTGYTEGARIDVTVDGTPGAATDMPGAIDFKTSPDGSGTIASVLKLDNAKLATFTGAIRTTATTAGWQVRSAGGVACNTTCTAAHGCLFGYDIGTTALVDCTNAAADSCVCSF